ncbi:hypothetical protein [Roseateles sp. LYH14W]|uniref:SGNH/GDSL hydrolase family protein n=1 Tax=Pelomonas parva TaxID=3299032 RepID=A0ABW7FBL5_9BURK
MAHPPSQENSMLRRVLIGLFQITIVVCLIDGFLDISYSVVQHAKFHLREKITDLSAAGGSDRESRAALRIPMDGLPVKNLPGIRNILKEYKSPALNVDANGRRENGRPYTSQPGHIGFLLGSSTAFGYKVSDNQTISAQLESAMPDTHVYNYAGLGQPTSDNLMRWQDLQNKHSNPDFVILAGLTYQLYIDCTPSPPIKQGRSNIFFHLAKITTSTTPEPACQSSDNIELAISNSIMSIQNAVAFGRNTGVPFYLVYLPTPFDENSNINHLIENANEDAKKRVLNLQKVYSRYHQELTKLNIPEFVDLSRALPADKTYFLDFGGHLTKDGNAIVAQALAQYIQPAISSRPPQRLQDPSSSDHRAPVSYISSLRAGSVECVQPPHDCLHH